MVHPLMKMSFILLLTLFLFVSCVASSASPLGFKTQSPELFESPAEWLWHYDGSIDALRRQYRLTHEDMFFIAYKYAEIGNHRRFEEALLYVVDNTNSLISSLAAGALLDYWQANRLFDQIAFYGELWEAQFSQVPFKLSLAEAFYWQRNDDKAWDLFQELESYPDVKWRDEHLLFKTVLALRLGKEIEAQSLYKSFIQDLPASRLA